MLVQGSGSDEANACVLLVKPGACTVAVRSHENTHTIPDPHLSHTGNLSVFPTDDATFVAGAFTLLNPEGLSPSPTNIRHTD